jgi:hypothetical protein
MCLDDGCIESVYSRRGRQFVWELPEKRAKKYWNAAAKMHGIKNIDVAYDDDDGRSAAENGMLKEGLLHWDNRVLRDLRRVPSGRLGRSKRPA